MLHYLAIRKEYLSVVRCTSFSKAMSKIPNITLNNGRVMPGFGLGTWQAKPGEVSRAVKLAIDLGYRHIDCAKAYLNETEVGQAIRDKIQDGTIKREDIFVTSKLWNTYHNRQSVVPQCRETLDKFGLDYIDLYLVHWPFGFKDRDNDLFPRDASGKVEFAEDDYVDTWKGMEECVDLGLAKSIGVSNFNIPQLERLLKEAKIKPVTNQVECHPYLNQKHLTTWCKEHDIVITAYSPLGSPTRPWAQPGDPVLIEDPRILEVAKRANKTPGQVILNYLVSLGVVPIPKSTNEQRLKDNISIFDFHLSPAEKSAMDSFNCQGRFCNFNDAREHKYYPFNKM